MFFFCEIWSIYFLNYGHFIKFSTFYILFFVLSFQKKKKEKKKRIYFLKKKFLVYLLLLPFFHLIQIKPIDLDGRDCNPVLGFPKHIYTMKMVNLKFFNILKNPVRQIQSCLRFMWWVLEDHIFFGFEYLFQVWVVINHKLSNYSVSNSNLHEPSLRNILNPFRRERLPYLRMMTLFFYVLCVSILYFSHSFFFWKKIGITFYL